MATEPGASCYRDQATLRYFMGGYTDSVETKTGREVPRAPVKTPPTLYRGLALFGANDGRVYCVRASPGRPDPAPVGAVRRLACG